MSWFRLDPFTLAILAAVAVALFLPCRGEAARVVGIGSQIAIAVLFFLQGARLSRAAVLAGILHWRLHAAVFAATFIAFPLIGVALAPLSGTLLLPGLYVGLVFLCALPSTVQASVVFTSIAGGNVPAALCSASLSSLIGMVLSPLLISLLAQAHGEVSLDGIGKVVALLLLPFLAGQAVQRWLGAWLQNNARLVGLVDRGSVLLMVYGGFSAATVAGVWSRLPPSSLLVVVAIDAVLLAAMFVGTAVVARRLGLARADQVAVMFCGTTKSLVTGIPMANALFPASALGLVVLPLVIYHQMQLMACATMARRYAEAQPALER
jgi:solute carrier family 10 (sodium/bile acid cotransporter), member 7